MFPIKMMRTGRLSASIIALVGLLSHLQPSCAIVDSSRPEISGFKLRHVDVEAEARNRAEKPITSLWEGAIHMKESLFVDASYVKCPAYGHLFKLIKQQNKEMRFAPASKLDKSKVIRQSVIQSLAIVATYDRIFYHKLFLQSLKFSGEHFLEAALELEGRKEPKAREAWLDVLCCLKEYIAPSDRLASDFLTEPKRTQAVESMSRFMSIPVEPEATPQGLVSNLIKRYNDNNIVVDPNMYESARVVILGLDDELTAQQRVEFAQQQPIVPEVADNAQHPLVIISGQEHEELKDKPNSPPPSEDEMKKIQLPAEIEIAVPGTPAATTATVEVEAFEQNYSLDQLAILKFIKMRLESRQKTPRISMRLVFDFRSHFERLLKARLDPRTDVGREAEAFRANETNRALYKRVQGVIDEYLKIIDVFAEIKTLNDKLESLEEFGSPLERLNGLLGKFDSSFDLNDIHRLQALWNLKYREYSTMQNFIDQDRSW